MSLRPGVSGHSGVTAGRSTAPEGTRPLLQAGAGPLLPAAGGPLLGCARGQGCPRQGWARGRELGRKVGGGNSRK